MGTQHEMPFFSNDHLPLLLATLIILVALYCTFTKINEVNAAVVHPTRHDKASVAQQEAPTQPAMDAATQGASAQATPPPHQEQHQNPSQDPLPNPDML